MRKYIENLKKINVTKTPFETSAKRFIEEPNLAIRNDSSPQKDQGDILIVEKTQQPSSSFKSGTRR